MVGAAAVVTKDVPDYAVVVGNPAKVVKMLDIRRQQSQEQEPAWVQRAVDYMDSHFTDQNLNVAGVADAVGINPVYLSRMLKKYRNLKPLEYIHQKRIEKAKQLLGQGVTVKDTLPQVGYSSALTMNRAFRRFEDTTPGAFYREK